MIRICEPKNLLIQVGIAPTYRKRGVNHVFSCTHPVGYVYPRVAVHAAESFVKLVEEFFRSKVYNHLELQSYMKNILQFVQTYENSANLSIHLLLH